MATADALVYNIGGFKLTGGFDWATEDVRMALVTSAYTFNYDHNDMADITNELSGGGYARVALANQVRTQNDTEDRIDFSADDVVFPSLALAAGTPAKAIIFDHAGGADANRQLICAINLTATAPNGTDYTVVFPSGLVLYLGKTFTYTP